MTEKELLYIEDAIGHETNICNILDDIISSLEEEELIKCMQKEVKKHENHLKELKKLLEDESNE